MNISPRILNPTYGSTLPKINVPKTTVPHAPSIPPNQTALSSLPEESSSSTAASPNTTASVPISRLIVPPSTVSSIPTTRTTLVSNRNAAPRSNADTTAVAPVEPTVVTTESTTTPRTSRAIISFYINEFD